MYKRQLLPDVVLPTTPTERAQAQLRREPPVEILPRAQISEMIGLVEAVADKEGRADLFELALESGRDFGSTLYLVKAAELLELVDTPRQTVVLTEQGKRFVAGDINARKKMLNELFAELRIVRLTTNLLRASPNLHMPASELQERISEWLPNQNPQEQLETLIAWGRFSEYLGYSDDTKEIYLDVGQETI